MTDTEREALCTRINELCAENERLRQENQSIGMAAYELGRKSMADENAKLRELVRDAWGSGHPDKSCGDCEIRDECHDDMERLSRDGVLRFSRCLFELRIEDRMRELGIEVG